MRELCQRKGVEIIEAHAMPDHIHMLVSIPPNEKVSSFMGYLKGKSTMIIFERYAHMKYKIGVLYHRMCSKFKRLEQSTCPIGIFINII